jgi:cytochrome c-type biogenesis protein CcmH
MAFWIILAIMVSTAAALLSVPFIQRIERPQAGSAGDIDVYRDRLKEVESERQQGVIDDAQAEAARLELVKFALAARKIEQPATSSLSGRERNLAAICVTGIAVLGSVGLYATAGNPGSPSTRSSDAAPTASASFTPAPPVPETLAAPLQAFLAENRGQPQPQSGLPPVDEMIQRLAARLLQNPKDGQGWRTLGWSYSSIGRFAEASEAYAKAIELSPNDAEIRSARVEALVRSADGVVTTDAKSAIEDTLKIDPKNAHARFYKGLARQQEGDKTSALTDWREVLRDAKPGEPWVPDLKNRISGLERELGVDAADRPIDNKPAIVSGSPETSGAAGASPMPPAIEKGPSPQGVRTADAMPPAERSAMVQSMVDRLANRLEKSPRDADGWIKLMQSRMVLGEAELAQQALVRGIEAFNDDTEQRDRIIVAAQQLGLKSTVGLAGKK